jgi:pimeloyl-ACP methyl ester carboxylesterase
LRRLFPNPDQEILRQALFDQILQADPAGYRATMRALARFDVSSRLREIHQPVLVISGDRDTTVPFDVQKALAEGITHACQVVVQDAGHAVSVEKPDEFNQHLLSFFSKGSDRK